MNVNELRVGSLVLFEGKINCITGIWHELSNKIGEVSYYVQLINKLDYSIKLIEAIPLTGVILLKCGFEYIPEGMLYANETHCITKGIGFFTFMPYCTNDKSCQIKIQYLHQLQNLYFALTEEELPITF